MKRYSSLILVVLILGMTVASVASLETSSASYTINKFSTVKYSSTGIKNSFYGYTIVYNKNYYVMKSRNRLSKNGRYLGTIYYKLVLTKPSASKIKLYYVISYDGKYYKKSFYINYNYSVRTFYKISYSYLKKMITVVG